MAVPSGRRSRRARCIASFPSGRKGRRRLPATSTPTSTPRWIAATWTRPPAQRVLHEMAAWLELPTDWLPREERLAHAPSAVVSLLCWDDDYVSQIGHSMGDDGKGILSRPFCQRRELAGVSSGRRQARRIRGSRRRAAACHHETVSDIGEGRDPRRNAHRRPEEGTRPGRT